MAHIRLYQNDDQENVIHIFRETAHAALRAHPSPDVLQVGSYLWCRPYILLCPERCFVLDDGNGRAVGYILCAPNTPTFVERYKQEFIPILKEQVGEASAGDDPNDQVTQLKKDVFDADTMMVADHPNLIKQYPAHLHIDILPSHQGQKWGEKLMRTLLDQLEKDEVKGIHLAMALDNDGAGRFYERMGFNSFCCKGGAIYLCREIG